MATDVRGHTVPAGSDAFDPQGSDVALALSLNDVIFVANATALTAAVAAISPTPSRLALLWQLDTAILYSHDGTTQTQIAPQETHRAVATGTINATPATVATVTIAAGSWELSGWCTFDVAEASAQQHGIKIRNLTTSTDIVTALDGPQGSSASKTLLTLSDIVTVSSSTSIGLQAYVGAVSGTQLLTTGRLIAKRVGAPS